MTISKNKKLSCAILYSGGTDSTCVAALMAKKFAAIHLLTFYQDRKQYSTKITDNIHSLENKFIKTKFIHKIISTMKLVKYLSYNSYFKYLSRHKLLILSTPGFTTLSWHINVIVYCLKNNIQFVADGLTRELMHFPGHMDGVIKLFKKLYDDFGIQYVNPVRDWRTPPDQQFIDRLIVDHHGYFHPSDNSKDIMKGTTGQYLYQNGIMPNPNVKGSPLDHKMQYGCYPFVLYNIMVFWIYLNFSSYGQLCRKMESLFKDKVNDARILLNEYLMNKEQSKLIKLLDEN